jgi:hypothetical protein
VIGRRRRDRPDREIGRRRGRDQNQPVPPEAPLVVLVDGVSANVLMGGAPALARRRRRSA